MKSLEVPQDVGDGADLDADAEPPHERVRRRPEQRILRLRQVPDLLCSLELL